MSRSGKLGLFKSIEGLNQQLSAAAAAIVKLRAERDALKEERDQLIAQLISIEQQNYA